MPASTPLVVALVLVTGIACRPRVLFLSAFTPILLLFTSVGNAALLTHTFSARDWKDAAFTLILVLFNLLTWDLHIAARSSGRYPARISSWLFNGCGGWPGLKPERPLPRETIRAKAAQPCARRRPRGPGVGQVHRTGGRQDHGGLAEDRSRTAVRQAVDNPARQQVLLRNTHQEHKSSLEWSPHG